MQNIRLAVLDMAGTTVDEDNMVYKTVQKAMIKYGYDVTLNQVLIYGAGKEKRQAIVDILKACTNTKNIAEAAAEIFNDFVPALKAAYQHFEVKEITGTLDYFKALRKMNIKVVLNTGYDAKTANSLLQKLNWNVGKEIDSLVTASDVLRGRPFPDMILKAMEMFDIGSASEVLKAGDSEIDILEGKNAGCGLTVGVLSGAQTREQLQTANPDYIFDNLFASLVVFT